jgi:integrase
VPGYHAGRSLRNKGQRYPADPPTVSEIVAVMRHAGTGLHADGLRALVIVLWRAGLRIDEALALGEADLDARRGSVLVRRGKGGRRREVGMDDWAWEQLQPWLAARVELPVGPHESGDHVDLPAGHRQHRDHRHRPRPPPADGPGRRNAAPVRRSAAGRRP